MMRLPLSVSHLLERSRQLFPSREVISRLPNRSLHRTTYGQVTERARRLAAALRVCGIQDVDRVGTLLWNHSVHLEAYFVIPAAGAVLHTLNLRLSADKLAYIVSDAQERLVIVDRVKDLVKSGGEWISSVDLENAIMGHTAVAEAAMVAIQHSRWTERPLAVVVLKAGQSVEESELKTFLTGRFEKWRVPDDEVFVEAIPRTCTGKFQKAMLRKQFATPVSKTPA